jgi:hypothetical protein
MKLKKGSKEAKAFMAKIRAAKGSQKKVGAVKTNEIDKIMSKLNKKSITALADFCLQNNIPFAYGWPKKTFLETIEDTLLSRNDNQIKKINFNRSLIFKKTNKKVGASFDSGSFKVLGKKNNQLVEISESPMTYEDAKKFIKNEGIEKYYSNVDIVPYRGAKKTTKYIGSKLKLTPKETRLGATDKDLQNKSYHKDTKSHNVNISVVSGFNELTLKQKRLYNKLDTSYNKTGLFKIVSFETYIMQNIVIAEAKRKSTTDLYKIYEFVQNDY